MRLALIGCVLGAGIGIITTCLPHALLSAADPLSPAIIVLAALLFCVLAPAFRRFLHAASWPSNPWRLCTPSNGPGISRLRSETLKQYD